MFYFIPNKLPRCFCYLLGLMRFHGGVFPRVLIANITQGVGFHR